MTSTDSLVPRPATISLRAQHLGTEHAFVVLGEVNRLLRMGRDIISFAIGQPDFATPSNICQAAKEAIDSGKHGYTASAGIDELRQAAARFIGSQRGLSYSPDDVVVANGAKPFIQYVIQTVTDPGCGHEVIYPLPGFPIYESQISAQGAKPVALPLREEQDFAFSIDDLAAKLNDNSRLLILSTPHNPTGRTLTHGELAAIAEVLQAYPKCWVLADEVYSTMVHDGAFASIAQIPGMKERTVVVDGVSKSYAMTGWRIGFAANPLLAPYLSTWITNTDSCAGVISQWAAREALEGPQEEHQAMMASFKTRRDQLYDGLSDLSGVKLYKSNGAFYLWPNVSRLCVMAGVTNAEALRRRWLEEAGVAVLADSQFGVPADREGGFVRFSYATAANLIDQGVARLAQWIDKNT